MTKTNTRTIVMTGIFAALCFVGASISITIPIGIGEPKLHLGNLFMLVGALVLGGVNGGLAAGIGMGLSDIFSGLYAVYAPGTLVGKFVAGFVCGKLSSRFPSGVKGYTIACIAGAATNVVLSTVNTIIIKGFINGGELTPVVVAALGNIGVALINAVVAVVIAVPLTIMIKQALKSVG